MFYSPKPRSQVRILIYRNWSIVSAANHPRSQGLSSSRPRDPLSRSQGHVEERPWERGWQQTSLGNLAILSSYLIEYEDNYIIPLLNCDQLDELANLV